MKQRLTKRLIETFKAREREFTVWDDNVAGFGVRVRPSGSMSYVVVYRAGPGRGAPSRRFTIAAIGKITPEYARSRAKAILGFVAHGQDPAGEKTSERAAPTVAELADRFISEHIEPKRKISTAQHYRDILNRVVKPAFGSMKADKLSRQQIGQFHSSLVDTPYQANRVLGIIGSMYSFAERNGIIAEGINPARKIYKFKEERRERFLNSDELERLGAAIVEAETTGIPWLVDPTKVTAKHLPNPVHRFTKINQFAAAALRLLLFTGCRRGEILHLKWEHVDLERGLLFLADSKTGRKTVILNGPAIEVLNGLARMGPYVVAGDDPEKPRPDLHRAWRAITKRACLTGVRLHDLRHTYASFGAGGGLGLPIIGRLLGHTQPSTTARYAHLDNDPLRRASEAIAGQIAAALRGNKTAEVISIRRKA
ncbi:MAG: tyrosine-type recombinase/integrase [Pseudolabrys sp.]|nr:tyrosine-type recombinase/integrase [Pseudolabrys sp.]